MAATLSTMMPLGTEAPAFTLYDAISGEMKSLESLKSEVATVVMFICNHCPYVKHVQEGLVKLAEDYSPKGISCIAISSNDVENYPEDAPERMKEEALKHGYPFPYLYDETQETARAYQAACTPDFFIFDGDLKLAYRGQFDASRPNNGVPVTGSDIRAALDAIVNGFAVSPNQTPSIGCNIKWKKNEG